jgi:hypothetical protein
MQATVSDEQTGNGSLLLGWRRWGLRRVKGWFPARPTFDPVPGRSGPGGVTLTPVPSIVMWSLHLPAPLPHCFGFTWREPGVDLLRL